VRPNTEHEQNHADFGELRGELTICDEARRKRPDDDTGDQITSERREPRAQRDESQQECQRQPDGKGGDQCRFGRNGAAPMSVNLRV
jgi:hypothetical protein